MGTLIEHIDGASLSVNDGVAELKRVFVLTGYTSELQVIRDLGTSVTVTTNSLSSAILPKIGDIHPTIKSLYAAAYNLQKVPKTPDSWKIDFTYRFNKPVNFNTEISAGPDALGFKETTARVTGKFDLCYRADPNFSDGIPGEDIGGQGVDVNGQPTSIMRSQYEIQFNETVNSNIGSVLKSYGEEVGTVCSGTVFGLKGAQVLYKGAAITRIAQNAYRLTHSYLYDQWYHTIQTPKFTTDGQVVLDENGNTATVLAVQPFPVGNAGSFAPA